MRVAVVGPGALGTWLCGVLSAGVRDLVLVDHDRERAQRLTESGLILEDACGAICGPVVLPVVADVAEVESRDLVILAVKSRDVDVAARSIVEPLLAPDGVVLSLQNGLGNVEVLSEVVGWSRVLAGATTYGATLVGPGRVRHTGGGEILIAAVAEGRAATSPEEQARAQRVADLLTELDLCCSMVRDWRGLLWRKVAVNAAVNALTALLRVPNGALLESESARRLAVEAAREAARTAQALDVDISEAGAGTLEASAAEAVEQVVDCALRVIESTSSNLSSSLQDCLAGRIGEVDAINGAVHREASRIGQLAPVNHMLAELMRAHDDLLDHRIGGLNG